MSIPSRNKSLKVFRSFHRLSQSALAEKIGVPKSFISEIESGKRTVTLNLVEKYAELFSIAPSEILALSEAYDEREYSSAPSKLLLKLIDWISIDDANGNTDDLSLVTGRKPPNKNSNPSNPSNTAGGMTA
jgi:transcriptional regulator with XRE-family HTH domain